MFDLNQVEGENTGWKALTPGPKVPAKLESVEYAKSQDGVVSEDLNFNFVGIADGNKGNFTFRVFANNFDVNHEWYNEDKAKRILAQIKHIMGAFLPAETLAKVAGADWKSLSGVIIQYMNPKVLTRMLAIKVTLDAKDKLTFPLFPDFIVSDLTPDRVLSVNTKVNPQTGLPYERYEPMAKPAGNAANSAAGKDALANLGTAPDPNMAGPAAGGDDLPF